MGCNCNRNNRYNGNNVAGASDRNYHRNNVAGAYDRNYNRDRVAGASDRNNDVKFTGTINQEDFCRAVRRCLDDDRNNRCNRRWF